MTTLIAPPTVETLADLHARLGGVPLRRIRCHPAPGTATEADVLTRPNGEKHLFELVDGVLVEKPMGYYESLLASILIRLLGFFLEQNDLGFVLGEGGMMRLAPGLVRIPDVSFVSWDHFPNRELPPGPVPDMAPDLAVEVISESNTEAEMERKLAEYFTAGTRLVWYVYPDEQSVRAYTSPTSARVLQRETPSMAARCCRGSNCALETSSIAPDTARLVPELRCRTAGSPSLDILKQPSGSSDDRDPLRFAQVHRVARHLSPAGLPGASGDPCWRTWPACGAARA
jgi:Uma2 family endonuclease